MGMQKEQDFAKDPQQAAKAEFVRALNLLSTHFDQLVENFTWCASQLMASPDGSAKVWAMIDFSARYHEFGARMAMETIGRNSGIQTNVGVPGLDREIPGIIVGLNDARYIRKAQVFEGVAVVKNSRGQEVFVKVGIFPNGDAFLCPPKAQNLEPETRCLLRDLYPKGK